MDHTHRETAVLLILFKAAKIQPCLKLHETCNRIYIFTMFSSEWKVGCRVHTILKSISTRFIIIWNRAHYRTVLTKSKFLSLKFTWTCYDLFNKGLLIFKSLELILAVEIKGQVFGEALRKISILSIVWIPRHSLICIL